jgi:hypothetical protein
MGKVKKCNIPKTVTLVMKYTLLLSANDYFYENK